MKIQSNYKYGISQVKTYRGAGQLLDGGNKMRDIHRKIFFAQIDLITGISICLYSN